LAVGYFAHYHFQSISFLGDFIIGTIIAVLIWGFKVVVVGKTPMSALVSVLPFVWYWHATWACIWGVVLIVIALVALLGSFFAESGGKRMAAFGIFLTSPLWMGLALMRSALFLGGTYALQMSLNDTGVTDQNKFIVGCVLYGLGLLMAISRSNTSSSRIKSRYE
jgi:hypothetical protein